MVYPIINPVETGKKIKILIKRNGRTAAWVAKTIGLSDKGTLYKWLRGEALPSIDNLLALSILFEVTINEILVAS